MQPRLCLVLAILVRACAEISLGALFLDLTFLTFQT